MNLKGKNTIDRHKLLTSKEYWMARIQNLLFSKVEDYIAHKKITKAEFAKELGCSRSYVTQLLNGDFDHRVSKLVEVLLAIGITPEIPMERTIETFLRDDHNGLTYLHSSDRAIKKSRLEYSLNEANVMETSNKFNNYNPLKKNSHLTESFSEALSDNTVNYTTN